MVRLLPVEDNTWNKRNKGKGSPSHHVANSALLLEILNHYNHHVFLIMRTTIMMIGFGEPVIHIPTVFILVISRYAESFCGGGS